MIHLSEKIISMNVMALLLCLNPQGVKQGIHDVASRRHGLLLVAGTHTKILALENGVLFFFFQGLLLQLSIVADGSGQIIIVV